MSARPVSSIWKNNSSHLTESFDLWWPEFERHIPQNGCDVFFRADDIGYPGQQFSVMIETFKEHETPLALAVVPAWMNENHRDVLLRELGPDLDLWCLHQHGYRHMNHEKEGKKFEFGPSRSKKTVTGELGRGKEKLANLLGNNFTPFFTPPWNRCSIETMEGLVELGFNAISRSTKVSPNPPQDLPDIPVNIDLHTVRTDTPQNGLVKLQNLMIEAIESGHAGFMLHHQRMNRTSQLFLSYLLGKIKTAPELRVKDIREIL
ncbi:polysaccharide deacetylase family protein [Maridesulfovibrio sp.]|uniref:polysaccharide deacetylase family protein n=1 Tax=unclassified Maridesulfovibrio TaxID=2794999 RepID=UPI003B001012